MTEQQRREQKDNLERVSARIMGSILDSCRFWLANTSGQFYMDDLRTMVERDYGKVAPDSPGRILRHLRQRGLVSYYVVSRPKSLYRVVSVAEA